MKCPFCDFDDSKVVDSRNVESAIRRRRQCHRCGLRFTTLERMQRAVLTLVKGDGRREEFNRSKLAAGLHKAFAKRPIPTGTVQKLVDEIEEDLQKLAKTEVPTGIVGEMVMGRIKDLDRVAYIRFASVYRDFDDVETFKVEVDSLLNSGAVPLNPSAQLPMFIDDSYQNQQPKRGRGRPRKNLG